MSKRKETKWSIERVHGASEREVNAAAVASKAYPTLAEMQRSPLASAKVASAVGKFLVPILLASALQSVAQAEDPAPPGPPVRQVPLGGAPMPAEVDPPPPPPPPHPPQQRQQQHPERRGQRQPPPPPPSGSHHK